MSLEPVPELLRRARAGRYAVGYFESWNLESLAGVIDAAEETRSPVIIGFSGDFLSRATRRAGERLAWYGALGRTAAEAATVPCGFIFNECPNDDWTRQAVTAGFNLVMPADPAVPLDDYQWRVADLTRYAHQHHVAVEAEFGELPCGLSAAAVAPESPRAGAPAAAATDPLLAALFVAATGVDLLAVSVGNVHIQLRGRRRLDLKRLKEISRRVRVPLVLHGGSGIADDSLRQAIALGVTKVNYGTNLKQHYLTAVRAALGNGTQNPHELLGLGGDHDLMVAGRRAVRELVVERMNCLGCCGNA